MEYFDRTKYNIYPGQFSEEFLEMLNSMVYSPDGKINIDDEILEFLFGDGQ